MLSLNVSRSISIVLVVIFAALYAAITVVFAPISYLSLQIRISEVLIALIPIYGWPALFGLTLGTFMANTVSPLGFIDLLVGTLATFFGGLPLLYLRRHGRGAIIIGFFSYAVIVSFMVALELAWLFASPVELMFIQVLLGELIAAGIGSTLVYGVLRRTPLPLTEPIPDSTTEVEK